LEHRLHLFSALRALCTQLLDVMCNDEYALVLSPQAFHNVDRDSDLFNNVNKQFWCASRRKQNRVCWPPAELP
jgi:hypothetical protein